MFSFFSKTKRKEKLFQELDALQSTAQLSVILALQYEFTSAMDKEDAMLWAVAIVNDLFGNPVSQVSVNQLDMNEVRRCADSLLNERPDYQELVVQSLRVRTTVYFGRNRRHPDTYGQYERILSLYGGEFPEIPKPDVYRSLVRRTIKSLPSHIQERLLEEGFWDLK